MNARNRKRAAWLASIALALVVGGGYWSIAHVERLASSQGAGISACIECHFGSGPRTDWTHRGPRYPSPTDLVLDPRGARLFVTARGTDEVLVVDLATHQVAQRFATGAEPHGLAVSPDGARLYVALRAADRIACLDASNGAELGSLAVGRRPSGVALTSDGKTLVVANAGSDDVSLIDTAQLAERTRLAAGREPYDVAIAADDRTAWVANRLAAQCEPRSVPHSELTVVDLVRGRIAERHELDSAHLSEGVAVSAADGTALVSLVRVRNTIPITQAAQGWVMTSGLGVLRPDDTAVRELLLDEVNAYYADPSGVVVDARRGRAYVASGGADCVSVVDLARLTALAGEARGDGPGPWADHLGVSSEYVLARIPVASNPRALLLAPDGATLYVAEQLGDSVALVDTEALRVRERISLGGPTELSDERRGEILFHHAAITFQGEFSCRSCHPDGHVDGLVYDFAIDGLGRNLVDNRSLLGIADTAPFKWNGKNKDLHEQCGPRFAKVLTLSDPFPPNDLDDLVAYENSLAPVAQDTTPTPARERGKKLFERAKTNGGAEIPLEKRCTTCHPPPLYTNRLLADVGVKAPTDTATEFDTPHLLGVADSAPYLHDGRARTLEEIWTVHSPNNTHGSVNDLSKTQLNDLVEFLKTL
jgi:YVTN family beta-propeller protein